MSTFVILARQKWGDTCKPLTQISGCEGRAINLAHDIYRDGGMNRVLVVDSDYHVVFKLDRRCKCINCQWNIAGQLLCVDCGREIVVEEYKTKEYQC